MVLLSITMSEQKEDKLYITIIALCVMLLVVKVFILWEMHQFQIAYGFANMTDEEWNKMMWEEYQQCRMFGEPDGVEYCEFNPK